MLRKFLFIIFFIISTQGCGYHLKGFDSNALPDNIKTIAIVPFVNETFESDMATLLESSLAEELSSFKSLKIVSENEADALLTGNVKSFSNKPVSFSSADLVQDYRVEVKVDVMLKVRNTDEVLWRGKGLSEVRDYNVEPGNEDLAEINKSDTKEVVADELAELIVDRIFEGF